MPTQGVATKSSSFYNPHCPPPQNRIRYRLRFAVAFVTAVTIVCCKTNMTSYLTAWLIWNAGNKDGWAQNCPSYADYSAHPHGSQSTGPLGLSLMRPIPACRTFSSPAVESVIQDMKARLRDPDLARLFENTFPNTLDTTVKYFDSNENAAFIITGDITAQWIRDTGNQFAHYYPILPKDKNLAALVKAVINTESRYLSKYPYCGAFQPPPESGLQPTVNDWATGVVVNPPVDNQTVFECKYELDSLAGFLKLSTNYHKATGDMSFMNANWYAAIDQVFRVIEEQSQGTWDADFNAISYYSWTGTPGVSLSPMVNNNGNGEPKGYTGLVGTHHRPSDDLSTFAFLTPANAMLSVQLGNLADVLKAAGQGSSNITLLATEWSERIKQAIWNHTVRNGIFVYETNGFGSQYIMDDANVPSLLSLPYLEFLDRNDETYKATRALLLSRQNPYYAAGPTWKGISGPHTNADMPWPMSLVSSIYGTDDDDEILESLYMIANNTAGLGLIHESQSIHSSSFTRSWFAWANSYFAEMLLDLAERKPHLIFNSAESYSYGK